MRRLHIINSLCLSVGLCLSFLHADNTRQSVTKELLSKTLSGGITTLEWVVRYESNSSTPLENVIITDNFSSAQTYVPSTEAHPDGWSVTQNPNQFVWETNNGNSYSRPFPEPSGDLLVEGEGDGWAPIPYLSTTGQKRIYLINHHKDASVASFNCVGECNGIWPKQLPTGDGSGQSSPTSQATETVTIGNKLFYGVSRTSDSGIACYDMENDSECGYIQLSALGSAPGGKCIAVDGLQRIGNALYIMDGNAIVYKVSITGGGTMSLAGSFDMTTLGMSTYRFTNPAISLYAIGSKVDGTKIYFSKGLPAGSGSIGCFDTATMSGCSGWGNVKSVPQMNDQGENTYFYYDNAMNKTAICVVDTSSTSRCFDLTTGTTVTRPEVFGSFSVNTSYAIGTELTAGTKTYFPSILEDDIFCYDWSTASPCSPDTIDDGTGRARNYAIALDAQGCAWVYGDTESATSSVSHLWSFDPFTGTQPCESGGELVIEDTYDASNNWCASENVEWRYTQFRIDNIDGSAFNDLNITFYDAAGNIIKTASFSSNVVSYSQGLFTAPFTPGEPIHYKIEGTWSGNTGHYTPPIITIGVEGPPREFCFNTTVPCPVTGEITNHVEVTLEDDPVIDSSADVIEDAEALCLQAQPAPQQCLNTTPKLTCTPAGWTIELTAFSPNTYNASNTDLQVIAPASATATKWGNTWYLNGVNPGDTLQLSMNGVQKGAGKLEGDDLCCDGESNITIPEDQTCEVEEPHIYVRKTYDEVEGVFDLSVRIMNTIYAPQVLTVTDTLPSGITITGIDPRSTSEWMCTNTFPVVGPASINCVYIGAMPVTGVKDLYLTSTVDNSQMPAENCADSGVVGTDGVSVWTSPMAHHCITIDKEDNNTIPPDNNDTNTTCGENEILIDGVCEQLPENPCPSGQQMVDGHCIEMPEINCQSNIILVVDKSDSIRAAGGETGVKAMMQSFLDRFRGNGSQAAIVYFDTTASIVRPMSTINVGDIPPGYSPTVGGLTNWEDALEKTRSIVSSGDIVFFITDGQPNRYLDTSGNVVPTGVPPSANTPALTALENLATLEASAVANQIKALGARIVSVGVGSIGSSASAIQHLNDIASTPSDINIHEFNELEGMANEYASNACPDLLLTKNFIGGYDAGNGCRLVRIMNDNQTGTFEIKVQNTTSTPLSGIVVRDVLPTRLSSPNNFIASNGSASSSGNTITWNVGALPVSGVETLRFDVSLPAIITNYEKIYNYAEVTNAIGVDVTPLLANSQNGPLNINEHDEAVACVQIYEYTQPPACDPTTDDYHCLEVDKQKLSGEGNCLAGGECRYRISIRNRAPVPYTSTLNITDAMTPSSAISSITITPQGSEPNPLCSPSPTSVPFSCTQTADIPANTTWSYNVVMSSTPANATKNCFKVNGAERCFNFPSSNKQAEQQENNNKGCQTDKDCQRNEYCSEEDGLCLPKEHVDPPVITTPAIEMVIPKPSKANITLNKTAPRECKAGYKCTFKLHISNKGKLAYKGPLSITDRSKEFVGKLVGTSPRGWRCKTTRRGYICSNPKVSLKAGESTTVKLTVRIPQRAKGYLNNCAKLDIPRGKLRIMAMQSMLEQNGFDPNGIDGSMGRGTKKALKAYMKSKGIKSKKTAIKKLVASYPHVTSKNSCVKVKIKKSKVKCKPHEKRIGDRCKPICKRWQHWSGQHCVSCPKGTKWDERKKRCRKVKCKEGMTMVKGKCTKIQKSDKPKCIPFVTHYSPLLGICVPNVSIGIGVGGGGKPAGGGHPDVAH